LPADSYTVEFLPGCGSVSQNWLTQWWKNASSSEAATDVVVGAGATVSGINAAMQPGGTIRGTVTNNTGTPLPGICIYVSSATGGSGSGYATSAADGTYSVTGLPADSYTVEFSPGCGSASQNWLIQWWKNASSSEAATDVVVGVGATVSGINAAMHPGGTITGKVTGNTGAALSHICVSVAGAGEVGFYSGETNSHGMYSVSGLPANSYSVEFTSCANPPKWLSQYWKASSSEDLATWVSVAAGKTVSGINATMHPGGTITGKVTGSGTGQGGICVYATPVTNVNLESGYATTASNGTYSITGLGTGDYSVYFTPGCGKSLNWLAQYYSGATSLSSAKAVSVTAGKTTSGVNATLHAGGTISGKVTNGGGTGLDDICVYATNTSGSAAAFGAGESGPGGTYTMLALPTGTYNVEFQDCSNTGYATQWYKGAASQASAKAVSVTAGKTTSAVDAAMVLGGVVTGTVTVSGGGPAANACVTAYPVVPGSPTSSTSTSSTGVYSINGLESGSYVIAFEGCSAINVLNQYYNKAAAPSTATLVKVTTAATTSGVNAVLGSGGTISGTVKDGAGKLLSDICVSVSDPNGASGFGLTGTSGTYSINGLPSGKYIVDFASCSSVAYANQWYKGEASEAKATKVPVTAGKTTGSINATMSLTGKISGKVTRPGGIGEPDVCVEATPASGGATSGFATTGTGGAYTMSDLNPGSYSIEFEPDCVGSVFGAQWYKGMLTPTKATTVKVTASKTTTGVSASLGKAGEISGTVKAGASPVAGVCVEAYFAGTGYVMAETTSNAGGAYELWELPAGNYDVQFSPDCVGAANKDMPQWWKGASKEASATKVTVTAGSDKSGINADLKPGGSISGTVKNSSGAALAGLEVGVTAKGSTAFDVFAQTGPKGTFTISGLPAGSYDVDLNLSATVCSYDTIYGAQWWKQKSSESAATAVTVTVGKTTTGINGDLTFAKTGVSLC
jgi:Carboxypeptidase regulatory-like domain